MRKVLLLIVSLFIQQFVSAQAGLMPYNFSVNAFSVLPTSGYTTNLAVAAANQDNWCTTVYAPAGFNFPFGGNNYTGFFISTNGWIGLTTGLANGSATPAAYVGGLPANALSNNTGGLPVIAPVWDDHSTAGMQWVYTAPVLTIRWFSVKWDKTNSAVTSFGVKLNTTSGDITFLYPNAAYIPLNPSASIGIAGVCAGDFYSVSPTASNTATVSNAAENSSIGNNSANNFRPSNIEYTFSPAPPSNDNCAGAINLGNIPAVCAADTFSTIHATASSSGTICSTTDDEDVWFTFTKPVGVVNMHIQTSAGWCNSVPGTSVEVFTGACGGLTSIGCATTNVANSNSFGELNLVRSACVSEVFYIRVTGDGNSAGKFHLCIESGGTPGATCATPLIVCSVPYSQPGLSTSGMGNEYDSLNATCHSDFMNGEDFVFSYTPSANQCIKITLTNTGSNPGVFITDGCPDLASSNCLGSSQSFINTVQINSVSLVAGTTYYIVVDNNSAGGSMPFDISISTVGISQPYDPCAGALNLGNVTTGQACTWSGNYSNECATPSPSAGYPDPLCGGFSQGSGPTTATGDVWFRFTSQVTGNLLIDMRTGTTNPILDAAMAVYSGTCGSFTLLACDDNSAAAANMPNITLAVTATTTYYIRVFSANATNTGTFQLCISANCNVTNELPCTAVSVPLGSPVLGDNTCSGSINEPPRPSCWSTTGTMNTVWFTAVVPASGKLNIKAAVVGLTNTQIAAYLFTAGCSSASSTFTLLGCNDNTTGCPCTTPDFGSELKLTGLTPGATIYIAVDGFASLTGTFLITAVDGNNPYPPLYGQDCGAMINVCSNNFISVPSASTGVGNICDPNASLSGCFSCGERSGVWYTFTVDPTQLQFTITPNAFTPVANFDFAIWNVTGQANPCTYLATATPIRCNNTGASGSGATGLSSAGGTGFSAPIAITGTTTFVLAIRNWNHTPVGYTIDWMGSNLVAPANPTLTWIGVADTSFTNASNWTCFSAFSCAKDVLIPFSPAIANLPTLSSNQTMRNLTILAGASLRIQSGVTLSLCGNLNVFGNLICEPGSTIEFISTSAQSINGSVSGANAFANLSINKTGGSVIANSDLDVRENFSTVNATSIFNVNGKYMKVGGNFYNTTGSTTFSGYAGSTVEFNGSGNQFLTNVNLAITFNKVRMNKTGGKLYLGTANSSMNIDSSLTFINGIIYTRNAATLEVNIKNNALTAVSGHSAAGYVDGRLRRKIYNGSVLSLPFSVDFPVGDSLAIGGYELANITFTSSTLVPDLVANFLWWPAGGPPVVGPTASECLVATYDALPHFNHGYWTFQKTGGTFTGNYRVTLYNNNFTNNAGAGWTVARADINANPLLLASWTLQGQCVITSTATNTQRDNMNPSPAIVTNFFNHLYSTVQSILPLPIELISFTAKPFNEGSLCEWITASETNNEYFEVQRSHDGRTFEYAGKVAGCGTCTGKREYSFYDSHECKGIVYYRLKQVDYDGNFTYSEIAAVRCDRSDKMSVFPNPATSSITVSYYSEASRSMRILIKDYTGRIVFENILISNEGFNQLDIPVDDLKSGVYFVGMSSSEAGEFIREVRFVKQ
jgi:hypothetical protein